MDCEKKFDKHFNEFISNDTAVRKFFSCKISELKAEHKDIFKSAKAGNSGIMLVNPDKEEEAKKILKQYYVFNKDYSNSKNQGNKLTDKFKVLCNPEYEAIMKDTTKTFNERILDIMDKLNKLENNELTSRQVEQYIYRNFSFYKYVKPEKSKPVQINTNTSNVSKFQIFLNDIELLDYLKTHSVKESLNYIKNKYPSNEFTDTQIINWINRQRKFLFK